MNKLKDMIDVFIKPLMKVNGFNKKRNTWNRTRGELVDIVHFEKLSSSQPNDERFIINIGIATPSLLKTIWGEERNIAFLDSADALLRLRLNDFDLGETLDMKGYQWIELEMYPLDDLSLSICKVFDDFIFPFFLSVNGYLDLLNYYEGKECLYRNYPLSKINLALLLNDLGRFDEGCSIMKSVAERKNSAWAGKAKDLLLSMSS